MNFLKTILSSAAIAAIATSASAVMVFEQQIDRGGDALAKLDSGATGTEYGTTWSGNETKYYRNTFTNIAGFGTTLGSFLTANPTYEIISATVTFGFSDDSDSSSSVLEFAKANISGRYQLLTGDTINGSGAVEVDGAHTPPPGDPFSRFSYRSGSLDADDFGDLTDGRVEFKITADDGDFFVKTAKISVVVAADPVSVPDTGSTVALLAASVLGLAFMRRRLARS